MGVFPEAMAHDTRTREESTSENSDSPMSRRTPIAALDAGRVLLVDPAFAESSSADRLGGVGFIVGDDVCFLSWSAAAGTLLLRRASAIWSAAR